MFRSLAFAGLAAGLFTLIPSQAEAGCHHRRHARVVAPAGCCQPAHHGVHRYRSSPGYASYRPARSGYSGYSTYRPGYAGYRSYGARPTSPFAYDPISRRAGVGYRSYYGGRSGFGYQPNFGGYGMGSSIYGRGGFGSPFYGRGGYGFGGPGVGFGPGFGGPGFGYGFGPGISIGLGR